ncbi:MAG TPA: hypothetical protein VII00_00130 [bacterium]
MNIVFLLIIILCFSAVYSAYTRSEEWDIILSTARIFAEFAGSVLIIAAIIAFLI